MRCYFTHSDPATTPKGRTTAKYASTFRSARIETSLLCLSCRIPRSTTFIYNFSHKNKQYKSYERKLEKFKQLCAKFLINNFLGNLTLATFFILKYMHYRSSGSVMVSAIVSKAGHQDGISLRGDGFSRRPAGLWVHPTLRVPGFIS